MAALELRGVVLDDSGAAISGVPVELFDVDTTSPVRASTTTDSSGFWGFSESLAGQYDVRITNGSEVVFLRGRDRVQFSTLTLTESAASQEALIVTRSEDAASVATAIFEGDRATVAADDAAYISLRLSDSAGNQDEQARIEWITTDPTDGAGQAADLVLSTLASNTLTEMIRLDGSVSQLNVPVDALFTGGDVIARSQTDDVNDGFILQSANSTVRGRIYYDGGQIFVIYGTGAPAGGDVDTLAFQTGGATPTTRLSISRDGVITAAGNIVPDADGTRDLGVQTTAQWANVWSDLVNGADYGYENGWRSLESDTYQGYGPGIAFDFGEHFETGKALGIRRRLAGTEEKEVGREDDGSPITTTVPVYARERVTDVARTPAMAFTEDFVEFHGRRFTLAQLDALLALVS